MVLHKNDAISLSTAMLTRPLYNVKFEGGCIVLGIPEFLKATSNSLGPVLKTLKLVGLKKSRLASKKHHLCN